MQTTRLSQQTALSGVHPLQHSSSQTPSPSKLALPHLAPSSSRQSNRTSFAEGAPRPGRPALGNGALVGERVLVAGPEESEDIKLECDESGCVLVVSKGRMQALEEDKADQRFLCCNLTGCFLSSEAPASEFQVLEGPGWRLGYETAPASEDAYSAMVGAGGWSIALAALEFHDFCRLIQMLRKGIITMDQDGVLGRDDVVLHVEKGSMWMECVVPKKVLPTLQRFLKFGGRAGASTFEVRFVLSGRADRRQAEGYWPAEAVMDMLRKIDDLSQGGVPVERSAVAA